jgi:hypothetical protein
MAFSPVLRLRMSTATLNMKDIETDVRIPIRSIYAPDGQYR